jgi:hypothetical protein
MTPDKPSVPAYEDEQRTATSRVEPAVDALDLPNADAEQRRRMAQCCAFFSAERFREAAPDRLRESDVHTAEARIEDALAQCADLAREPDAR